jgi:hypothetical protein
MDALGSKALGDDQSTRIIGSGSDWAEQRTRGCDPTCFHALDALA